MNKSYYAIITADVRYNKNLPDGAKLLFGEITALCNERGYCWANNSYFAELYSKSNDTISRWISALKNEKLINLEVNPEDGNSRKIFIDPTCKNADPMGKNAKGYRQKCSEGIGKNAEHNNTVNNTNNNLLVATGILLKNIEEFKKENPLKYPSEFYVDFINYWTEANTKGKQRWECEKFFELPKRLATWQKKKEEFANKYKPAVGTKKLVI